MYTHPKMEGEQSIPIGTAPPCLEIAVDSADKGLIAASDGSDRELQSLSDASASNVDSTNEENKVSVHVAIQAYDYEIERTSSILPARRRIIPFKFRDFQDPDEIDDGKDSDFVPKPQTTPLPKSPRLVKTGAKRGRPRKIPKDHAYGMETDSGSLGQAVQALTEGQSSQKAGAQNDREVNKDPAALKKEKETEEQLSVSLIKVRPYKCDCGLSFQRLASYKKHKLQTHSEDKSAQSSETEKNSDMPRPFKCTQCNKRFGQKGNLKVHMRTHTGEKPFKCDLENCGKNFCSNESLRRHKLAHLGIKLFECNVCQLKFSSNVALKEHMSRHTDTKPYECQICKKRFRQVSCYKRHLVTHSSELPHKCDVCGKGFSQTVYLKSHMRSHTGEKPYQCQICGKAFAHASDKTRHQTVHTGEKRYACSVCGSKFSDPSTCRRHVREHSGQKPYPCQLCGETFKRAGQLKAHLNKKHVNHREEITSVQLNDGGKIPLPALEQGAPAIIFNNDEMNVDDQQLISRLIEQKAVPLTQDQLRALQVGQSMASINDKQILLTQQDPLAANRATTNQEHIVVDPSILEQIQNQLDPNQSQLTTEDGHPVQVAYQIIHDDENQQIVEIQYQAVGAEDLTTVAINPTQPQVAELAQNPVDVVPAETLDSAMEATHAVQNPEALSIVEAPGHMVASEPVDVVNEPAASEDQVDIGDIQPNPTITSVDILSSAQTLEFVANPNFNSQEYYNWLSNFTEACKELNMPLNVDIFQEISHVHKTLSDILATPKGVLSNKDNFKILMSISRDLNEIINKHLTHVLSNLDDNQM